MLKKSTLQLFMILGVVIGIQGKCDNHLDKSYEGLRFVKCSYSFERYDYKLHCEEPDTEISCEETTLKEIHSFVSKENENTKLYVKDSTLHSDDTITDWRSVTDLFLENIKFPKLDDNLFKYFKNLRTLEITKSELTILPANVFKSLENLQKLNITGNSIKSIDKNAFVGLENVTYFSAKDNDITTLPNGIFNSLKKVEEIDLSRNKLTKIENVDFPKSLKQIVLSSNQISGDFNFLNIPALKVAIDLSDNQIDNLVNFNESNAEIIKLTKNKIKTLPKVGEVLEVLDISLNSLNRLDSFCQSNLRIVNMSFNEIDTISPNAFEGATNLRLLYLSNNKLGVLNHGCFNHLASLIFLDLSHNNIQNFTFGLMDPFKSLLNLDISYNNHEIDLHTILTLKKLESLNIAGNKIDKFDPELLVEHFPQMKKLSFDDTIWNCKELVQSVAILEKKSNIEIEEGTTQNEANVRGIKCSDDITLHRRTINLNPEELHPKTMDQLASSFLKIETNNQNLLTHISDNLRRAHEENRQIIGPIKDTVLQIMANLKNVEERLREQQVILKEAAPSATVSTFIVFIALILFSILGLMVYNVFYARGRLSCSGDQIGLV